MTERDEQIAFFEFIRPINHPAVGMTFHVPNGAIGRKKWRRIGFWQDGVMTGVTDIITLYPGVAGPARGKPFVIEMKFGSGVLTKEQAAFRDSTLR